ncbi:MAG: hypothetical protein ACM336_08135 [Acidobacteriota bacterium]
MQFAALLLAALEATYASPNCGPAGGSTPWACGAWRTRTPPPLGRAGAIMTDPDTGNRVLRVTQAGSFGEDKATAFKVFDGGWQRAWNADGTRFFVVPWGGRPAHRGYWLSFDARKMKTRSKAAAVPDEFSDFQWDQSDPDLIVGMSRGAAVAYNVRTKEMARLFDPAAARWGGVPRVSAWGGRRVCIAEGPQDTGHRIVCFHRDTGKAQIIDLREQTIDRRRFPVIFQGKPASLPSTVGIHAITVSPDGRSVAIDTHGNSMCSVKGLPNYASTALFLDLDAGAAYEWNTGCGSTHWAYGYDGVLMQSASAKWTAGGIEAGSCASDSRGIARRNTDKTVDSSYVQTAPCSFFARPTWDVSVHLSWTNNHAGPRANAVPVLLATTSSAGSGCFLANDIAAMETSTPRGQGRLWRFAQTWNDPVKSQCAFLQYSSPAISPDGRWALFPSNWRGQTGSGGVCTGGNRTDVFLFELK